MGPLDIHLNGAPTGDGFVIVSSPAQPLPATLTLRTMDGSEGDVACRPAPGSGTVLSFTPSTVHVSGMPVEVQVLATAPSDGLNDSTIEVVQGDEVVAQFALTALAAPRVRFSGRYQVRLATDQDPFDHAWGTSGATGSFFRMYAVDGPDPLDPFEPPLDRIIRFQDGVALRPFCDPIGVEVTGIEAGVGGSLHRFTTGDPLIGLPVRLGPTCRFEEQDGEFAAVGLQPIADFRLEIGSAFAGESEQALPRLNPDPNVPPPSKAPYANGVAFLDNTGSWTPSDFGYPEATWVEHSMAVVTAKLTHLLAEEPADERATLIRTRRLREHVNSCSNLVSALRRVQQFTGEIDRELELTPHPVGALAYLGTLPAIAFSADFFDFDSDCQSGTVTGTLGVAAAPPLIPPEARLAPAEARGAGAGGAERLP